ncbi:hypothetical protein EDEG_03212 [Edhazardia aedis USNM 41457]|uniref:Vid27 PH-like domain-containing protein n=1 Tax=Edhazardia aedis (strain USNM 41457) TaxID=1003232 RepID=J8ZRN0_EDHAE|nr:hypothetical protein EDEG_03212 [Edhazardia aedis USNM 41457]|eukprot:EJW02353.1 hypothetical protein EDEG_03212 [Edhazardia aedis USNM 41457]
MVFQAFRRLFQQSNLQTSNLYKNSKNILSNCDISTTESGIKFTSARNEKVVKYCEIYKILNATNNELTFNLRNTPSDIYLFVGSSSIKSIVDTILLNLKPKDVVFSSDEAKMCVFNVKKGKFDILSKNCVVSIFRESVNVELSVLEDFSEDFKSTESDLVSENTYVIKDDPNFKSKNNLISGETKVSTKFVYHLRVDSNGDIIYHEEISANFQTRTEPQNNTFIWNTNSQKFPFTFSLAFKSSRDFNKFVTRFVSSFYTEDEDDEKSLMRSHLVEKNEEELESTEEEVSEGEIDTKKNPVNVSMEKKMSLDMQKN